MEEKERYYYKEYAGDYDILDRNDKNAYYGAISRDEEDSQNLINLLNKQDREIKRLSQENQQLKQSQKQLAIAELEKVKEYNHTLSLGGSPYIDVFINNQIKELKGEE